MQYSSQHSLTSCYGAHSLAPSYLRSLASSVMLSGDAAIMPDLPSFLRSLVAHCEADFMRISCVMWAIHSQSRNNRHFFALPSLSPSSTSSSSSSCACAIREGEEGEEEHHTIIHPPPPPPTSPTLPTDRPTDRRSTDNNRREKQASPHALTTERPPADSLLLLFGSPCLQSIMNWDSAPKSGATGLFVVLQFTRLGFKYLQRPALPRIFRHNTTGTYSNIN